MTNEALPTRLSLSEVHKLEYASRQKLEFHEIHILHVTLSQSFQLQPNVRHLVPYTQAASFTISHGVYKLRQALQEDFGLGISVDIVTGRTSRIQHWNIQAATTAVVETLAVCIVEQPRDPYPTSYRSWPPLIPSKVPHTSIFRCRPFGEWNTQLSALNSEDLLPATSERWFMAVRQRLDSLFTIAVGNNKFEVLRLFLSTWR